MRSSKSVKKLLRRDLNLYIFSWFSTMKGEKLWKI